MNSSIDKDLVQSIKYRVYVLISHHKYLFQLAEDLLQIESYRRKHLCQVFDASVKYIEDVSTRAKAAASDTFVGSDVGKYDEFHVDEMLNFVETSQENLSQKDLRAIEESLDIVVKRVSDTKDTQKELKQIVKKLLSTNESLAEIPAGLKGGETLKKEWNDFWKDTVAVLKQESSKAPDSLDVENSIIDPAGKIRQNFKDRLDAYEKGIKLQHQMVDGCTVCLKALKENLASFCNSWKKKVVEISNFLKGVELVWVKDPLSLFPKTEKLFQDIMTAEVQLTDLLVKHNMVELVIPEDLKNDLVQLVGKDVLDNPLTTELKIKPVLSEPLVAELSKSLPQVPSKDSFDVKSHKRQTSSPEVSFITRFISKKALEGEKVLKVAIALYNNEAEDNSELGFSCGDRLYILDLTNKDWFWCSDENGNEGYVPSNYIELVDKSNRDSGSIERVKAAIEENYSRNGTLNTGDEKRSGLRQSVTRNTPEKKSSLNNVKSFFQAVSVVEDDEPEDHVELMLQRFEKASSDENINVPPVIYDCVTYLLQHGLDKEGIFRLSNNQEQIKKLAIEYQKGSRPVINQNVDPMDVAGLLKHHLMVTTEPPLSVALAKKIRGITKGHNADTHEDELVNGLKDTLNNRNIVSESEYLVLQMIFYTLHEVALNEKETKMTSRNLARLFGLTLFHSIIGVVKSNAITETWIRRYHDIFTETSE